MGFKYKNLTTEIAEHAEARMAKGSRGGKGKSGSISNPSQRTKPPGGFQKRLSGLSAYSAVDIFFFLSGWQRDFFIFLCNESMEDRGEIHNPKSAIRTGPTG
jgi:hypothetical protein